MTVLTLFITLFLHVAAPETATTMTVATPTATPRQVVVTVTDAAGAPVAGQGVALTVHVPLLRQTCVTGGDGRCTFTFTAAGDLLRGELLLPGRGRRSLLWKGARLAVTVALDEAGMVDVGHDHVPLATKTATPAPESAPTIAAAAPGEAPTMTASEITATVTTPDGAALPFLTLVPVTPAPSAVLSPEPEGQAAVVATATIAAAPASGATAPPPARDGERAAGPSAALAIGAGVLALAILGSAAGGLWYLLFVRPRRERPYEWAGRQNDDPTN